MPSSLAVNVLQEKACHVALVAHEVNEPDWGRAERAIMPQFRTTLCKRTRLLSCWTTRTFSEVTTEADAWLGGQVLPCRERTRRPTISSFTQDYGQLIHHTGWVAELKREHGRSFLSVKIWVSSNVPTDEGGEVEEAEKAFLFQFTCNKTGNSVSLTLTESQLASPSSYDAVVRRESINLKNLALPA